MPCSLRDRGRHCQRTFILTPRSFFFLFGLWICGLESDHIGLTRSVLTGKKHRPAGGGDHMMAGGSLAVHRETLSTGLRTSRVQLSARGQRSTLLSPSGFSEVPSTGCCPACFSLTQGQDHFYIPIHLKVK